jgi:hypothetical protein
MKLCTLFVSLVVALTSVGCRRQVVVTSEPERVVVVREPDSVWDGHVWITVRGHVHSSHCGHYWHHGCWHLYPEDHVYYEAGYGHFGLYVEYRDTDPYVWDGGTWIVVRGHTHGPRCGHYFHHQRWHVRPESHVYERRDQGHWGTRVEPLRPEPRTETPDRKRPEPPREPEPRKPEPRQPEPPKKPEPPRKPDKPDKPK